MKTIKRINRRDLQYLIDEGYIDEDTRNGVSIVSRFKKSNAKHYYVQDTMAYTAWEGQGLIPMDKEFQKWQRRNNKRRK